MRRFIYFSILFSLFSATIFGKANALPDSSFISSWENKRSNNLFFIENKGQFRDIDGKVAPYILFKAQTKGLDIYVTDKGLSYVFIQTQKREISSIKKSSTTSETDSVLYNYSRFDIDLKDAIIKKENIITETPSSIKYNFFYSHCKEGVCSVNEFKKITITNVYPGIDWILYQTNQHGLKYDFIVHKGVDADKITLLYKSLNCPSLNQGRVQLTCSVGSFSDEAPISFLQESKLNIRSSYVIKKQIKKTNVENEFYETEIGFKLAKYSTNETLIIDPLQLWWGTYYGGTSSSDGVSITTDTTGNVFVLGNTYSTDIPTKVYGSLAYFQGNNKGLGDPFILKFTNTGQLLWATYFGGTQTDIGVTIKCDKVGNLFFAGSTSSKDFPVKNFGGNSYYDSTNHTFNGYDDIFVAKFSNSGQYIWGTYYGGTNWDKASCLDIDNVGNIYITGSTNSSDFPIYNPGGGAFCQTVPGGGYYPYDSFILKFSNSGNLLLSSFFGGNADDAANSVVCDNFGNAYFGGRTASTNLFTLNPGNGAYFQASLRASGGNYNGYILKLNNQSQAVWSTYLGGSMGDEVSKMICDSFGNLLAVGGPSRDFPTVNPGGGAFFLNGSTSGSIFISKFDPQAKMTWSTFFGYGSVAFLNLTLGKCQEFYISFSNSTYCNHCSPVETVNPSNGAYYDNTYDDVLQMGETDIFIAAFTNSGIQKWGTFFGGDGNDISMVMTTDKNGNLFYTGNQGSNNYSAVNYQSYTSSCITKNDSTSFFQPLPLSLTSQYCVIGKFSNSPFSTNYTTSGCGNANSASLQVNNGFSPISYLWSNGITSNSINNVSSGTYTCIIKDDFGCEEKQSILLGKPSILLTNTKDIICEGQKVTINAQGANSFSWTPSIGLSSTNGNAITASPTSTTNYTITGYNSPTCGVDTILVVTVNPLPILSLSAPDSICQGQEFKIIAIGTGNFNWIPSSGLSCNLCPSPTVNIHSNQQYIVVITDVNSCVNKDSIIIRVKSSCSDNIFIPNIFSPNGDGINDIFNVKANDVKSMGLEIYDRWGINIFSSDEINPSWDGRTKSGEHCSEGTYFYLLRIQKYTGENKDYKGFLTLVK
jgi:gliding motility-associated-like protein